MLSVNNVLIKYGDRTVLNYVSFAIKDGDRIGLVGKNGAGKSTLLKIIAQQTSPHDGNIAIPNGATIGFLHQDMVLPKGKTVLDETLSVLSEIKELEADLDKVNNEIATRTDFESESYLELFNTLEELNERYRVLGGQTVEADAQKILMGLGFKKNDFDRLTDEFSGGWQMRIELTKMLLQNPDYLLLDEPTNHLDIESIIWLENFLESYEGSVVVISHDKTFLDNVTKRTIEIELGSIHDYPANYSNYLTLRKERREQLRNAYENQQKEIARKERLIEKFRAKATKAKMAQSLIKELDRMDKIELDVRDSSTMSLQFPPAPRSGEVVVKVEDLSKSYGDLDVLQSVNLKIIRNEKVAFVGKNGEGKSTLTKIILGLIEARGTAELGYNVEVGYYAQNQAETLNPKLTVLETIEAKSPPEKRTQLRSILGSFLFSGEDVEKKVSVLSGGERARLALACMLLRPINLLVLDEPTNHLDIPSKDVLKSAIKAYDGTMIIVSHDRDFLEGLTEKVIEFNDKKLKTYLGDVKYFLKKRALDNFRDVSLGKEGKNTNAADTPAPKAKKKVPKDKNYQKKLRKLQKDAKRSEQKISKLEHTIEKLETKMADTSIIGTPEYDKVVADYEEAQEQLEVVMEEWEAAELALEELG